MLQRQPSEVLVFYDEKVSVALLSIVWLSKSYYMNPNGGGKNGKIQWRPIFVDQLNQIDSKN